MIKSSYPLLAKDEDFPKLKITPNNYFTWKTKFINVIKMRHPDAGAALETQTVPTFTPTKQSTDPLFDEEAKMILKRELDYKYQLPSIWAEAMLALSPESERRVMQHKDYDVHKVDHDIIELWKIIEITHLTDPATLTAQVAAERQNLMNMNQRTTHIEEYNSLFTFQVRKLETLLKSANKSLIEEDIVQKYLLSLNYNMFGALVKDMLHARHGLTIPTTLADAQSTILSWYNTETSTMKMMTEIPPVKQEAPKVEQANVAAQSGENGANDKKDKKKNKNKKTKNKNEDKPPSNAPGHAKNDNKNNQNNDNRQKKPKKLCTYCKERGLTCDNHWTNDCGHVKRLAKENGNKLEKANITTMNDSHSQADSPTADDVLLYVTNVEEEKADEKDSSNMRDNMLVLDNACTAHVVRNKSLLSDLQVLDDPIHISGVGGKMKVTQKGILKDFGTAYIAPDSPFNLISFKFLRDLKCKRQLDDAADMFHVHMPNGSVYTFRMNDEIGLYTTSFDPKPDNKETALVNFRSKLDPQGNRLFSQEEVRRAQDARLLHEKLDHISDQNLCSSLTYGKIINCPVTCQDVRNAHIIFGPCPACIQGKLTNEPASNTAHPAEELGKVIHMDIFFIKDAQDKQVPYLISVEGNSGYLIASKLPSKSQSSLSDCIGRIFDHFKSFGHTIKHAYSDNEKVFRSIEPFINSKGATMTFSPSGRHERRAERAIRTLKGRIRAALAMLPYKLPRSLLQYLIGNVVSSINMSPNSRSTPASPKEIFQGTKTDFSYHLRSRFGDFILTKDPNGSNDVTAPQAEHGIIVGRDPSTRGGVKVYLFHRKTIVTRSRFVVIPPTAELISIMNDLSVNDPAYTADLSAENDENLDFDEQLDAMSIGQVLADTFHQQQQPQIILEDTSTPDLHVPPTQSVADALPDLQAAPPVPTAVSQPVAHRGDIPQSTIDLGRNVKPLAPQQLINPVHSVPIPAIIPVANPPPQPPPRRNPSRSTRTTFQDAQLKKETYGIIAIHEPFKHYGLNFTTKYAIHKHGEMAVKALTKEIVQMHSKDVWIPLDSATVTREEIKSTIPAVTIFKEKYKPDGSFDKLKARTSAGGNRLDPTTLAENLSSPTVDITSVYVLAALAALESWYTYTIDIAGAFLNACLPEKYRAIMRLDKQLADIYVKIKGCEDYKKYLRSDGSLLVLLKKALYGHPMASMLWYEHLSTTFMKNGYKKMKSDECIFVKTIGKEKSIICIHVDDILHICSSKRLQDELETLLIKEYKEISVEGGGDTINYLGMRFIFDRSNNSVSIDQKGYVEDLIKTFNISGTAVSPATSNLFEDIEENDGDNNGTTNEQSNKEYASKVMKLMYLAKRTRPDILLAVSYLSTKIQKPRSIHFKHLNRIYRYIASTPIMGITLKPTSLQLHAYVDAAYSVHSEDFHSHSGVMFSLGSDGGPIFAKSVKQRMISRSSTDAEVIALYDTLPDMIWLRTLLIELCPTRQDVKMPIIVYQDNQSTITLCQNGISGRKGKSKHMLLRYYYIKEKIANNEIEIQYLSTTAMIADILTKPLNGKQFLLLRKSLLNQD
jgi:hypothetical protein